MENKAAMIEERKAVQARYWLIRRMLDDRGLTMRAIAKRAKVSESMVSKVVGGSGSSRRVEEAIARACVVIKPDAYVLYMGNNEVNGPFGPRAPMKNGKPWPLWLVRARMWMTDLRIGQLVAGHGRVPWHAPESKAMVSAKPVDCLFFTCNRPREGRVPAPAQSEQWFRLLAEQFPDSLPRFEALINE